MSSITALVAEPDFAQRQQLLACLGAHYRVLGAARFAEAVDVIAREHPQVLVLEPNLPDGDGFELIRRLRADPSTRAMIIACATTRSSIREKVAAFQAGGDDYVIKPIDLQAFAVRVLLLVRFRRLSS
jgi:two-component system phosphate regulon response regulator PhoB